MSYTVTSGDSIASRLPSAGAVLKWGFYLLLLAFFGGLMLTETWQAYAEGRMGDATLGLSVVAALAALVVLFGKRTAA
ncbi:MAG: hypothetical protein ABEH77_01680 [Halobacteriaceae archaeon]